MTDKPDDVDKTNDGLDDAGADNDAAAQNADGKDAVSLDKSAEENGAGGSDATDATDASSGDKELVGATAGSARAAARRGAVSGTTESKGRPTRARDAEVEKLGFFARIARFLKEVVAELRKVIWPARNQMVTYTIVVIVFVVFMVAFVSGLDVLFARLMLAVFG